MKEKVLEKGSVVKILETGLLAKVVSIEKFSAQQTVLVYLVELGNSMSHHFLALNEIELTENSFVPAGTF